MDQSGSMADFLAKILIIFITTIMMRKATWPGMGKRMIIGNMTRLGITMWSGMTEEDMLQHRRRPCMRRRR